MNTSENDSGLEYDYLDPCYGSSRDPMVLPALLYIVFIFGVLGNAVVLWVLFRCIKLKTMTDVCLLNLASSDLIMAASLPLWASNVQTLPLCQVIMGVYQLGLYSGSLFVTFMSIDRYLAIVHAVAAMRARSLHCGIIISFIIWIISTIMAVPQVVFASLEMEDDDVSLSCGSRYPEGSEDFWKKLQNFSENIVNLFVCLPIIMICYVKILLVLSKTRNSKKDKAVKLILVIVCLFVMCWVPYNLVVFFQTLQLYGFANDCTHFQNIRFAQEVTEIIALLHCCVNPIVYAFVGEKFRKSLVAALPRCIQKKIQQGMMSRQKDTTEKETTNTPLRSK